VVEALSAVRVAGVPLLASPVVNEPLADVCFNAAAPVPAPVSVLISVPVPRVLLVLVLVLMLVLLVNEPILDVVREPALVVNEPLDDVRFNAPVPVPVPASIPASIPIVLLVLVLKDKDLVVKEPALVGGSSTVEV
jgi:hypothetical protein